MKSIVLSKIVAKFFCESKMLTLGFLSASFFAPPPMETLAKYWITFFVFSVLPAPLSPLQDDLKIFHVIVSHSESTKCHDNVGYIEMFISLCSATNFTPSNVERVWSY